MIDFAGAVQWRLGDLEYGGWSYAINPPRRPADLKNRGPWDWSNVSATLAAMDLCLTILHPIHRPSGATIPPRGGWPDVKIPQGTFHEIGVESEGVIFRTKQLSMNWWLSKRVQRRLTLWFQDETWRVLGIKQPAPPAKP